MVTGNRDDKMINTDLLQKKLVNSCHEEQDIHLRPSEVPPLRQAL